MSTRTFQSLGWALFAAGLLCGLLGIELSEEALYLGFLVVWFASALWLRTDAARRHVPLAYDWGWFVSLGWPFLWIWYARHTSRRWRATLGLIAMPLAVPLGGMVGLVVRMLIVEGP